MPLTCLDFRTCADRRNEFMSASGADRYFADDVAQAFDRIEFRLQPNAGANPRNPDDGCTVHETHQGRQSQPPPGRRTGRARSGGTSATVEVSTSCPFIPAQHIRRNWPALAQATQFSATKAESRSRVRHDRRGDRQPTWASLASARSFWCMLTTVVAGIYTKALSASLPCRTRPLYAISVFKRVCKN